MAYKDRTTTQPVNVVQKLATLLGFPAISDVKLLHLVDNMIELEADVKILYPKVFTGLGCLKGEYRIKLKEDDRPYALSLPHRVPAPFLHHDQHQGRETVDPHRPAWSPLVLFDNLSSIGTEWLTVPAVTLGLSPQATIQPLVPLEVHLLFDKMTCIGVMVWLVPVGSVVSFNQQATAWRLVIVHVVQFVSGDMSSIRAEWRSLPEDRQVSLPCPQSFALL